jgi:hypothetical protein
MLDDLDKTITRLLRNCIPQRLLDDVTITFATPGKDFPPKPLSFPAVDLFMHKAIPNAGLRQNAPIVKKSADGSATKTRPPVYLDCTYLVSVWTDPAASDPPSQEHEIFAAVMKALVAAPALPEDVLYGSLAETQTEPVVSKVSDSSLDDTKTIWQALGVPPRLSLNYTVTFSMPLFDSDPVTLVTKRKLVTWLTEDRAKTEESVLRQVAIGGVVRSGMSPVASVLIEVKSKSDQVVRGEVHSRAHGAFYFMDLAAGEYEVVATAGGSTVSGQATVSLAPDGSPSTSWMDLQLR